MAIPTMSQLHAGVGVNIVLKADQKTGKLTTGTIADFLTRGDHPRALKVRLASGLIGRVQSLSSIHEPPATGSAPSTLQASSAKGRQQGQPAHQGRGKATFKMQDDYRNDPTPQDSIRLEDYIKPARKRGKKKGRQETEQEGEEHGTDSQAQLQVEFPDIDSALIAAILADHSAVQEARQILGALS